MLKSLVIDAAHGQEIFPVTVCPTILHNGRTFYSALPPEIEDGSFEYDAGPLSAPTELLALMVPLALLVPSARRRRQRHECQWRRNQRQHQFMLEYFLG